MAASLSPTASLNSVLLRVSDQDIASNSSMAPSDGTSATALFDNSISLRTPESTEVAAFVEASVEKSASSKRIRRRDRRPKPKPKLKKQTAQCVGYYVDALDKKMLWGEARIIKCNPITQKIKVHFVGWSKNYDLWTDPMSITVHGRYAPRIKDKTVKSWDGDMHLFEDMLGVIKEATVTSVPVLGESSAQTTAALGLQDKTSDKKSGALSASLEFQRERLPTKRKILGRRETNATSRKGSALANTATTNRRRQDPERSSKRTAAEARVKESTSVRAEPSRRSKKQKCEAQQSSAITSTKAVPSAKARPSSPNKVRSPNHLPLFRDLELDDGTVLEFSVQRDEARVEQEGMQSFLDKCALIWKKQLALSVQ